MAQYMSRAQWEITSEELNTNYSYTSVLKCFELYNMSGTLKAVIKSSMGQWKTTL